MPVLKVRRMRGDMHKVVVERPRYGHGLGYHEVRNKRSTYGRALDDLPSCEGMRRAHLLLLRETKTFSDRLGPLRRYLEGQAGRRWDEVFAEICAGADRRDPVKAHLHSHLADFVTWRVRADPDGRLRDVSRGWSEGVRGLYVDTGGIVTRAPPRPKPARSAASKGAVHVRDELGYREVGGIWYEVTYRPLAPARHARQVGEDGVARIVTVEDGRGFDIFDGWVTRDAGARRHDAPTRTRVAVAKRQLSRVELRRAGLRNDPR